MNATSIHKAFISKQITLIVSILIFLALRFLTSPDWGHSDFWGAACIQIGIALVLLQVNQTFTIIRNRTLLPAFFYLLLTGTNSLFYYEFIGSVISFCIVLSLIFLFHSYQEPQSQTNALNLSLAITLGSLLWTPILFFFPLFWYGFYQFRSLSWRVFFSSLIGFFSIYLFVFAWSVYQGDWNIFLSRLPRWEGLFQWHALTLNLQEWVIIGFLIALYLIAGFNLFMSGISEKIRTFAFLNYLYVFSLVIFVFFLLQNEWKQDWTLILCIPVSFVLGHYFTLSTKKKTVYLFLLCIFFFLGMFVWQQYFPSS